MSPVLIEVAPRTAIRVTLQPARGAAVSVASPATPVTVQMQAVIAQLAPSDLPNLALIFEGQLI